MKSYKQRKIQVYLRRMGLFPGGKKKELSEIQISTMAIVRKLINNKDSELIYAPLSSTCYIKNSEYLVRFDREGITITNGKFSYFVWINEFRFSELKQMFYNVIESRMQTVEDRFNTNTLSNLRSMLQNVSTKPTTIKSGPTDSYGKGI